MQAKITVKNMSCSIPSSSYHTPSQFSKKGGVRNQHAPSSLSEDEKKRRKIFKGKCYRCGSGDLMQPACKLPSSINCNVCHQPGHLSPVCSQFANARMFQQDSSQAVQPHAYPAIQYMPDGAASPPQQSNYSSALAHVVHSSADRPIESGMVISCVSDTGCS